MNERNLPRMLSTSVVDALKAQGHILVVKGGATALARELSDLMAPLLAQITPRIDPYPVVGGEVTSTFGHESIDDAVEEMVAALTHALMDSEHVEDVFAEDNVIRRDIFRTLRDGLLTPAAREAAVDDDPTVPIVLDTLGYVAATVSKLAPAPALREALSRAGDIAGAQFTAYDPETRTATFVLEDDDPDARLELEEAIADELTDLVDDGSVELPTIERRIDLGRTLTALDQRALMGRIDVAGKQTLLRAGCHATWEFETGRALRITFTPFSDQDARDVDVHVAAFARELAAVLHAAFAAQAAAPVARAAPFPGEPAKQAKREAHDHDLDRHRDDDLDQEEEEEEEAPHAAAETATPKPKARLKAAAAPKRAAKTAAPKRVVKTTASSSPRKSTATAKSPATAKRAAPAKAKAKAKKAPAKKR